MTSFSILKRHFSTLGLGCLLFMGMTSLAQARLGESVSVLRKDEFLRGFVDSTHQERSALMMSSFPRYKPFVSLSYDLAEDSSVSAMTLTLARGFVEGKEWMFAHGYARAFLMSQLPVQDTADIRQLQDEIEYPNDKGMMFAGGVPSLPEVPSSMYQAFRGHTAKSLIELSRSSVEIASIEENGVPFIKLTIRRSSLTAPNARH
jgi:hypothetical protein